MGLISNDVKVADLGNQLVLNHFTWSFVFMRHRFNWNNNKGIIWYMLSLKTKHLPSELCIEQGFEFYFNEEEKKCRETATLGSIQTFSGKNHHYNKGYHPLLRVGAGPAGFAGIWFSALRTGFWTCPSPKQQLSVTYIFPTHTPAQKDLSSLLEG